MTHGTCRCGARWKQRGNLTGHCGGCHLTFHGEQAFDQHFTRDTDTGRPVCIDPHVDPQVSKSGRTYWEDPEGVWHYGPPQTHEQWLSAEASALERGRERMAVLHS